MKGLRYQLKMLHMCNDQTAYTSRLGKEERPRSCTLSGDGCERNMTGPLDGSEETCDSSLKRSQGMAEGKSNVEQVT